MMYATTPTYFDLLKNVIPYLPKLLFIMLQIIHHFATLFQFFCDQNPISATTY